MTKLRSELSSSYKKKHERVENNTVLEIKYKIIDMINLLENKEFFMEMHRKEVNGIDKSALTMITQLLRLADQSNLDISFDDRVNIED